MYLSVLAGILAAYGMWSFLADRAPDRGDVQQLFMVGSFDGLGAGGAAGPGVRLQADLIRRLSALHSLRLPTPEQLLRAGDGPPLEVARRLEAAYLLSGSWERDGERLRLRARLLDVDEDRVLWSETYDARGEDLGDLGVSLVDAVVRTLKITPDEAAGSRAVEARG